MADGYISQIKTPDNKVYLLKDSEKTDEKVAQIGNNEDKDFPVLIKNTNNTTNETSSIKYSNNITDNVKTSKPFTYNPSTAILRVPKIQISTQDDTYGLFPQANNWNQIGASNLYWYRSYIYNYYGGRSHVDNWDSGKNIGTAANASAAATKGTVNFYNSAAANATQTKTLLEANDNTNSNITITLPSSTGTLALTSQIPTNLNQLTNGPGYVTSSGITSVTIGATSPVQSSTSTAQTGSSASTTISLADAYGDTKNPYGSKTKNYVLAAPSNANGAPGFRALVAADIPDISGTYVKKVTSTDNAIARFDGTGGAIQNSNVKIDDNGHIIIGAAQPIYQNQADTSNYTAIVTWLKNGKGWIKEGTTYYTYQPQIGQHNTGGDGTGSITILPYPTDTAPWGGSVGLFIRKGQISLDNNRIPHTNNTTGNVGGSTTPVYVDGGIIKPVTLKDTANALINALDTGSSPLTANDYVITQYVGGGTTTTTYHRRPASQVVNGTLVKAALGTVGTTAKKFLKDTGAWVQVAFSDLSGTATNAQLANSKVTIAGNDVSLGGSLTAATLTSSLGLSNALHFIGITSTTLSDGSTTATLTAKSTNSLSKTTGFVDGDVVMDGDQLREYVWSGSAWRLLGITTSTAYTQPASTATNTWIAQVSQGTDGKITATTGSLNTSGTWSGNAGTATKLSTNASNTTASFWRGDNNWSSTLTGSITISKAGECGLEVINSQATNPHKGFFGPGSSGNLGIYDRTYNKWIVYSDPSGNVVLNGNANTATSAGKWTTARTLTIGSTGKSVDGSGNVSWTLTEIGAAPAVTGGYLPLSGGTLTGALTTANNTWNTIGDDAYLGDINKAGHIGIQGKNGNTGIFFTTYNQTTKTTGGAITWDGTKFSITSTTAVDASISGNAATATSISKAGGSTANFWRGDNKWANSLTDQLLIYNSTTARGDSYSGGIQLREFNSQTTNCELNWYNAPGITFHWGGRWVNKLGIYTGGDLFWGSYKVLHAGNTAAGTDNNKTLAWGTAYTIAKINGTDIKFTTMAKPSYTASDVGALANTTKYAASSSVGGAATYAATTANTADSIYPVGVKSDATTTLLHDTSITMKGGAISATTYTVNSHVTLQYNTTDSSLDFIFT